MALLRALQSYCSERSADLAAAHFDHGLRASSAADAGWLCEECDRLQIPLIVETRSASSDDAVGGLEEAARAARYEFLARAAAGRNCPYVAVGHTADDQVETVLHHILRGTGLDGLRGMRDRRELAPGVNLIRPLLEVTRANVVEYLNALGQGYREDETNVDAQFTRNRIRHVLLPLLREQFNPRIDEALQRLARHARDAGDVVREQAEQIFAAAVHGNDPKAILLDCTRFSSLSLYLLCEMLRVAWRDQGWPEGGMTQSHWQRLAELARTGGPAITLPGPIQATRRGNLLVLESDSHGDRGASPQKPGF